MTRQSTPTRKSGPAPRRQWIGLVAGPVLAAACLLAPPPPEMAPEAWRMVAMTVWMVTWWLTEAVPIPATALLPLVLMPLFAVGAMTPTAAQYAHPLIFLFLGGFLLAAAMQRVGLHRRIALGIVAAVGTSPRRIILGFMLATAFLSMWVSNTATAMMMYTVGLSVIALMDDGSSTAGPRGFGVALMLSIAYSASIGGVGTLIGTPPNALMAGFLASSYGLEITFSRWMLLGVPVVAVMLPLAWLLLTQVLFAAPAGTMAGADELLASERASLGRMRGPERMVAAIFAATAAAWLLRAPLATATGLPIDDTLIAIAAALVLFAVPATADGVRALDWAATRELPWGILLLFGGGLALARGFSETGLAAWIGQSVGGLTLGPAALVLAVLAAIVLLTEITSNTASTATFLPILGAVAVGLGLPPALLCVPVALGASMAFMMPVATPPNAIVFAYEPMRLGDMLRAGVLLNLIAIATSFALFRLLGPYVFDIGF
ncbi:anion transporter [Rhodobacteraceae bacterium WD3A24]|nr:anion transporter [Rhodobacteraceae bacterium WD3A24]